MKGHKISLLLMCLTAINKSNIDNYAATTKNTHLILKTCQFLEKYVIPLNIKH